MKVTVSIRVDAEHVEAWHRRAEAEGKDLSEWIASQCAALSADEELERGLIARDMAQSSE